MPGARAGSCRRISAKAGPQTVRLEGTVLGIAERKHDFDGPVILHADWDGMPRSVRIEFGDADRDKGALLAVA